MKKNVHGITLIALVITIIVLLILAGVSIAMLTGQNGILTQAQNAKTATEQASADEKVKVAVTGAMVQSNNGTVNIDKLKEEIEAQGGIVNGDTLPTTVSLGGYVFRINAKGETVQRKEGGTLGTVTGTETSNTTVQDALGNHVVVPAGFKIINPTDYVTDGIVVENTSNGNQYVWIPCTTDSSNTTKLQYKRTEWGVENDNGSRAAKDELTLTESDVIYSSSNKVDGISPTELVAQVNAEKESINKNGGYYIGRYEVGTENGKIVIKQSKNVYANTWANDYKEAKKIEVGSGATAYLCSSYAWDTAINFIEQNSASNYATSIDNFNGNWLNREVKNENGIIIKPSGTAKLLATGLTTGWSNIYDMGGNVGEFTTEINPGADEPVVPRGGYYDFSVPAGSRWDGTAGLVYGFRATLFLK